ncbi:hypothetical protein KUCAC02_006137, partial [Chaenocephalus aceratus]
NPTPPPSAHPVSLRTDGPHTKMSACVSPKAEVQLLSPDILTGNITAKFSTM